MGKPQAIASIFSLHDTSDFILTPEHQNSIISEEDEVRLMTHVSGNMQAVPEYGLRRYHRTGRVSFPPRGDSIEDYH